MALLIKSLLDSQSLKQYNLYQHFPLFFSPGIKCWHMLNTWPCSFVLKSHSDIRIVFPIERTHCYRPLALITQQCRLPKQCSINPLKPTSKTILHKGYSYKPYTLQNCSSYAKGIPSLSRTPNILCCFTIWKSIFSNQKSVTTAKGEIFHAETVI